MEWKRILDASPWGVRAMPRGGVMDWGIRVSIEKGAGYIFRADANGQAPISLTAKPSAPVSCE